jgi:hypothetical protein
MRNVGDLPPTSIRALQAFPKTLGDMQVLRHTMDNGLHDQARTNRGVNLRTDANGRKNPERMLMW